jgi:hypothetical protein
LVVRQKQRQILYKIIVFAFSRSIWYIRIRMCNRMYYKPKMRSPYCRI